MKKRNEIDNIFRSIHVKKLSSAEKEQIFSDAAEKYEQATGRVVSYQNIHSISQKGRVGVSLYRKVLVGALIFGLTSATAYASNESVPGDFLFPLDRALESVQLGFVSGDTDARLRVKIAEERLEEVDAIIARSSVKTEGIDADEEDNTPSSTRKHYLELSDDDIRHAGEGLSLALGMLDDIAKEVDEDDDEIRSVLESFNSRADTVVDSQTSSKVKVRIEEEDDDEDDKRVRVRVEEQDQEDLDKKSNVEKVRVEVKSGRVRVKYESDDDDVEERYEEASKRIKDEDEMFDKDASDNASAVILSQPSLDDKEEFEDNEEDEEDLEEWNEDRGRQENKRGRD